ncbi:MAG: c-type cytochrome [Bacteroidetes bacterium]|nr:c-type cytochrome [Bacteroidota bacterium]
MKILSWCYLLSLLTACNENSAGGNTQQTSSNVTSDTLHAVSTLPRSDKGKEIFQARCNTCHGINGNSQYQGNSRYTKAADLQMSRLDSISIVNTIKNGRQGMPSFGGAIPDTDLSQLVIYVKSLQKT